MGAEMAIIGGGILKAGRPAPADQQRLSFGSSSQWQFSGRNGPVGSAARQ